MTSLVTIVQSPKFVKSSCLFEHLVLEPLDAEGTVGHRRRGDSETRGDQIGRRGLFDLLLLPWRLFLFNGKFLPRAEIILKLGMNMGAREWGPFTLWSFNQLLIFPFRGWLGVVVEGARLGGGPVPTGLL